MLNTGRTFYCGEEFSTRRAKHVPLKTACCWFNVVVAEKGEKKCGMCGALVHAYATPSGVRVKV